MTKYLFISSSYMLSQGVALSWLWELENDLCQSSKDAEYVDIHIVCNKLTGLITPSVRTLKVWNTCFWIMMVGLEKVGSIGNVSGDCFKWTNNKSNVGINDTRTCSKLDWILLITAWCPLLFVVPFNKCKMEIRCCLFNMAHFLTFENLHCKMCVSCAYYYKWCGVFYNK